MWVSWDAWPATPCAPLAPARAAPQQVPRETSAAQPATVNWSHLPAKAPATENRGRRKRGRRLGRDAACQGNAWANTIWSLETPPTTPPRRPQAEVGLYSKSPAEKLGLLFSQSPAEKLELLVADYKPPPLAFATGGPLLQTCLPVANTMPFCGWCLEEVGENPELSGEIVARLEVASKIEIGEIIAWFLQAAMPLSLSRCGTRVIQKALDRAGGSDRWLLVDKLKPFVVDLYESPHGNYVLAKIIETMPANSLGPLIGNLRGKGRKLACHRFGCRILERLIEHCDQSQIGELLDEIVQDSAVLCKHQFGNFVVQHLIEFSVRYRGPILEVMLQDLPTLATHRVGSHVVQKAMDHSDEDGKQAIVAALLEAQSPRSLTEIACNRYGSYVLESLSAMSEAGIEVKESIAEGSEELSHNQFGIHVLKCFHLEIKLVPIV